MSKNQVHVKMSQGCRFNSLEPGTIFKTIDNRVFMKADGDSGETFELENGKIRCIPPDHHVNVLPVGTEITIKVK